jgi:hypothetical protein
MMSDTIFEFRKLTAQDVFPMFKILSKIGINEFADVFGKENVQKLMAGVSGGNITTMMGISVTLEMANIVLGNLPKCENEIYQMLANTSNLSVEEVKALDIPTFTAMVIAFIKKEEFRDFLQVVSGLFN